MGTAVNTEDAVSKDSGTPVVVGNPDNWVLLTKFVSSDQKIAKSTKACNVEVGCVVQVTTKEGNSVAEAVTFVPGVMIVPDVNNGHKLVQRK